MLNQSTQNLNSQKSLSIGKSILANGNVFLQEKSSGETFAEKLKELREQDDDQNILREIAKQAKQGKSQQEIVSTLMADPSKKAKLMEALQKGLLNKQVQVKQQNQEQMKQSSALVETEDPATNLKPSEQNLAEAAQANTKTVTEAAQQGNVAQQDGAAADAQDRKKMLAKWDKMVPRVIEDVKNRAVRVDIPGIEDLQSLIVRVSGNGVSIQVAGSEQSMKLLKDHQGELRDRLSKHEIKLGSLKTFYAAKQGKAAKNRGEEKENLAHV